LPLLQSLYKTVARTNKTGQTRVTGLASHVIKDSFDSLRPAELTKDPLCASYYIFNAAMLLRGIRGWANEQKIANPIHYVFAGGDGEGRNLELLFDFLWQNPDRAKSFRLYKGLTRSGYDTAWMKQEPALQAADVGCFELHKNILLWIRKGYPDMIPQTERRRSLSFLSQMMSHRGWAYREQELRTQFADRIKEIKGLIRE
jgi:hypothetical protein